MNNIFNLYLDPEFLINLLHFFKIFNFNNISSYIILGLNIVLIGIIIHYSGRPIKEVIKNAGKIVGLVITTAATTASAYPGAKEMVKDYKDYSNKSGSSSNSNNTDSSSSNKNK
jgi:hypothetical protein